MRASVLQTNSSYGPNLERHGFGQILSRKLVRMKNGRGLIGVAAPKMDRGLTTY